MIKTETSECEIFATWFLILDLCFVAIYRVTLTFNYNQLFANTAITSVMGTLQFVEHSIRRRRINLASMV